MQTIEAIWPWSALGFDIMGPLDDRGLLVPIYLPTKLPSYLSIMPSFVEEKVMFCMLLQ